MSKFKVGDRVRFKNDCYDYGGDDTCASKGDCGSVVATDAEDITVELDAPSYITTEPSNLDIIEPADRKTAFLEELRELLMRHNAKINFAMNADTKEIGVLFEIGDDKTKRIWYPFRLEEITETDSGVIWQTPKMNYPITAENLMDYDKGGV